MSASSSLRRRRGRGRGGGGGGGRARRNRHGGLRCAPSGRAAGESAPRRGVPVRRAETRAAGPPARAAAEARREPHPKPGFRRTVSRRGPHVGEGSGGARRRSAGGTSPCGSTALAPGPAARNCSNHPSAGEGAGPRRRGRLLARAGGRPVGLRSRPHRRCRLQARFKAGGTVTAKLARACDGRAALCCARPGHSAARCQQRSRALRAGCGFDVGRGMAGDGFSRPPRSCARRPHWPAHPVRRSRLRRGKGRDTLGVTACLLTECVGDTQVTHPRHVVIQRNTGNRFRVWTLTNVAAETAV